MSGPVYPYRDRSMDHLGPWDRTPAEFDLTVAMFRVMFEHTREQMKDGGLYVRRFLKGEA